MKYGLKIHMKHKRFTITVIEECRDCYRVFLAEFTTSSIDYSFEEMAGEYKRLRSANEKAIEIYNYMRANGFEDVKIIKKIYNQN